MWEFILIWILCGLLAFRLDCRRNENYDYEHDSFSGFFIIILFGGISLSIYVAMVLGEKLEESKIPYILKKRLYQFIVGKESKRKNIEENE